MQYDKHVSVLLHESIQALDLTKGLTVLDGTTGNGGHSKEIAERISPDGHLVCIDLDSAALTEAKRVLEETQVRMSFFEESFRNFDHALYEAGIDKGGLDRLLLDLGLRTEQITESGRGFSFMKPEEPLLMTFSDDIENAVTARDALNYWSEEVLADCIFRFGDERKARKIARLIVEKRAKEPFARVEDLLEVIDRAYFGKGKRFGKTNPATKTFQAIRIAVNDEVGALDEVLVKSHEWLAQGGITSIITFHSLEDRIVKRFSRDLAQKGEVEIKFKRPVRPSDEEVEENPRSRSAKLRSWRKL